MNSIFNPHTAIALCIICMLAVTISSIVSNHYERKHIRRIYDLFSFLQKSSEERIGRANNIVEQCTSSIQHAAVASEHCAKVAEQMAAITQGIAHEHNQQVEELRHDKNRMFEQMTALTAQLAAYQNGSKTPTVSISNT